MLSIKLVHVWEKYILVVESKISEKPVILALSVKWNVSG